jgi:hypothetical protein
MEQQHASKGNAIRKHKGTYGHFKENAQVSRQNVFGLINH